MVRGGDRPRAAGLGAERTGSMEGTCANCGLVPAVGDMYCGNCGQPVPAAAAASAGADARLGTARARMASYPATQQGRPDDDTRAWQTAPAGNGWTGEERAARAARKGSVRNWLVTGDKHLDPDSAKGRELAPAIHDGLAIASFVLVFFFGPGALICGILSLAEARRERRRASGLAVAGIIISVIEGVIVAAIIAFLIISAIFVSSQVATFNPNGG